MIINGIEYIDPSVMRLRDSEALTFSICNVSRGVLRGIISHQTNDNTLNSVVNAFVAEIHGGSSNTYPSDWFISTIEEMDLFATTDSKYNEMQIIDIFSKLKYQLRSIGSEEFLSLSVSESSIKLLTEDTSKEKIFKILESEEDIIFTEAFNHILNENWKTNIEISFSESGLESYFSILDSAKSTQMNNLSKEIKKAYRGSFD